MPLATVLLFAFQISVPLGLDRHLPLPAGAVLSRQEVALGERLFAETALSRDGTVACRSCHSPERAFTDDQPQAVGVRKQRGARRSPTLLNRVYGKHFFWDGRAASLEEQVLQPITNPKEMDLPLPEALQRLRQAGYGDLNAAQLARALAAYVRTILAGDSPYDRYLAGDQSALTAQQRQGLELFRGKANCIACHLGPNLTDEAFHNTGLAGEDAGRSAISGKRAEQGAFKTPTLRQVAERPPYMHNGALASLEEVVAHYDRGGRALAEPGAKPAADQRAEQGTATSAATKVSRPATLAVDEELAPLRLTAEERLALVAFLRSLSGRIQAGWPL